MPSSDRGAVQYVSPRKSYRVLFGEGVAPWKEILAERSAIPIAQRGRTDRGLVVPDERCAASSLIMSVRTMRVHVRSSVS